MTTLICDKCGNEFNYDELIDTYTAPEYPGASVHPDTVSPCCHADWEEVRGYYGFPESGEDY